MLIETSEGNLGYDEEDCLTDLIYKSRYKEILKKKFPQSEIREISNKFFPGKFSIKIPNINEDEYYAFIIKEGIADYSLNYLLREISKTPANLRILENLLTEAENESGDYSKK